jgi:hypothetical protein
MGYYVAHRTATERGAYVNSTIRTILLWVGMIVLAVVFWKMASAGNPVATPPVVHSKYDWVSYVLQGILGVFVVVYLILEVVSAQKRVLATTKRIEDIERRADEEPEKTKFAWDLARTKLEAYFDRNLSQVGMIFGAAIIVMFIGFGFVVWGVELIYARPNDVKPALVASVSGVITQFIGATFIFIYRSTMAQANRFMEVLERINTVGMAVQLLDGIPDAENQLKNQTRAEIIRLLLGAKASAGGV